MRDDASLIGDLQILSQFDREFLHPPVERQHTTAGGERGKKNKNNNLLSNKNPLVTLLPTHTWVALQSIRNRRLWPWEYITTIYLSIICL